MHSDTFYLNCRREVEIKEDDTLVVTVQRQRQEGDGDAIGGD